MRIIENNEQKEQVGARTSTCNVCSLFPIIFIVPFRNNENNHVASFPIVLIIPEETNKLN